jgi:hypothetical protein
MNLEIRSFADAGVFSKERIILKALTDLDVGDYAVFRSGTGTSTNKPTSGRKIAYWFPDFKVEEGDLVVLYTKRGTRGTKLLDSGRTAHYFYWGRDEMLWGDNQFGAVLLEVSNWQFKVPS